MSIRPMHLGSPVTGSHANFDGVSRIERAFERRFRELLSEFGARDREKGVRWLFSRAADYETLGHATLSHALAEQNIDLAEKARRFRERRHASRPVPVEVFCDAGLGGLARWLRALGVDAHWRRDISDGELVMAARKPGSVLITTDSLILERRPISQGEVQEVWVPPSLTKFEQLRLVRAELNLPGNDSRCMRCGGELLRVDKLAVRNRIPPKTYVWVDEYFECARCGQLFWEGTHWQRVARQLERSA